MSGSARVMGFGTFDGLHPGHASFLKQLRTLGDELFVVVARDNNVKKIKGCLPRFSEDERAEALRGTGLIDHVILGDPKDFYQPLRDHRPNVIGLGYDQKANEDAIRTALPGVKIVRMTAFHPEKYKSSLNKNF